MIRLDSTENPYGMPEAAIKAINQLLINDPHSLSRYAGYYDDYNDLKKAWAEKANTESENIVCANGSNAMLAHIFESLFKKGMKVLTPELTYFMYLQWAKRLERDLIKVQLDKDLKINVEDYKNAEAIVIANPNNPTGIALSLCEIEQLLKNNPNGIVVIDEAFIDFSNQQSATELLSKYPNLLVVQTMSKYHGFAGCRVGYGITGNSNYLATIKDARDTFNPSPIGAIESVAAQAAIADPQDAKLKRNKIIATRARISQELGCPDTEASFLLWQVPKAEQLFSHLKERGTLVTHLKHPRLFSHLRVGISTDENMDIFLDQVREFQN